MKSPLLAAFFLTLTVAGIAAGAATPPAPAPKLTKWQQLQRENFKNSAPADEYFGKTKMSYLGMNNTFRDSAISSGEHTTDPAIVNKVALAEDALEAWARKYPRDPQLARTYYLATVVDRKIWIKGNQERAWIFLNRLAHDFPATYFGKQAKHDIASGFTEHYYAPSVPCATPLPVPSDTASADVTPDASPTPSPAPSPSPAAVETTLSRGLRVQIIPQPCIPAPSPSPSPSPSASPSSTGSPDPDPS